MPTDSIVSALDQEDALCDQAIIGLSDWLSDSSRVPLRHPLTAACSVLLRHIDTEEKIVFPRILLRAPQHAELIDELIRQHASIRESLTKIENLVIADRRSEARAALAQLRELQAEHCAREKLLTDAIAECMTDPSEIGHLFHSGYFRGKFSPFKPG